MATKVLVPRLGEGVDELTIVKWLKNEGDPVTEMESLLEVETDKVVTEIPSPAAGVVLKISALENTPVRVGEVMAWIGEPGERVGVSGVPASGAPAAVETGLKVEGQKPGEPPAVDSPPSTVTGGFLAPVVRKMAAEYNIDLSQVRGAGLNGRITKQDILSYLERSVTKPVNVSLETEGHGTATRGMLLPITSVRKQIAERMRHSKQISPHVLTVMEADMSRVAAHRAANKAAFVADGVNLTYTAYFMTAIAAGLKAHPLVNSTWTEQGILVQPEINIGMATSLGEEGLIVPVLRRADELSLLGMARAVNDLAGRARARKLRPEEVRDGTFTLTNHGTGGSLFAMPIINQPQCGILGVGALHKRPVVVSDAAGNDAIAIRPMV
ncbi:MAG: 2-oxo acid dehydrogenase subunit E2, partial [Chloroflexi bacterium]|nr:2-oxo acid dehydrogenase subunit E2 [Chloroflexota bacterium]